MIVGFRPVGKIASSLENRYLFYGQALDSYKEDIAVICVYI